MLVLGEMPLLVEVKQHVRLGFQRTSAKLPSVLRAYPRKNSRTLSSLMIL
jgi:hypothetical protein